MSGKGACHTSTQVSSLSVSSFFMVTLIYSSSSLSLPFLRTKTVHLDCVRTHSSSVFSLPDHFLFSFVCHRKSVAITMVKKTDTYARVLRPGESMTLGRKFSEFEVIFFRPKQQVRCDEGLNLDQQAEGDAGGTGRDSTFKDSATNPSSGGAGASGNKVRFALAEGIVDSAHADKKRNGATMASSSVANAAPRDAGLDAASDEGAGPPMGKRGSSGGYDIKFADLVAEAPLFFDTTVCIFYDELTKMDYVATGRTTADSKGIHYVPHLVVLGDEFSSGAYCNYNITLTNGEALADRDDDAFEEDDSVLVSRNAANNGPITMCAADGVSVNLRRLGTCSGFLVCATLFGKDAHLNRERNVFYMIRKPRNPSPMCLIPLCVSGDPSKSCISLMIRKIKVHGDSMWEVVNVNEGLALQDVKSLVLRLQDRGLVDPAHFTRDFELKSNANRANDAVYGGGEDDLTSSSTESSGSDFNASHSQKRLSEGQAQERSLTSEAATHQAEYRSPAPPTRSGRTYSGLLVDVPRVTREGRRQYNVGRSHVQSNLFDGDTSEEDEVLDDAMRAVVPHYTNASLIRYENGAYNIGSKVENLVAHYIDHRETYGLDAAGHRLNGGGARDGVSKEMFPALVGAPRGRTSADWGTPLPVLDRCQVEGEDDSATRPELPPDLLITSQDRRIAASSIQHCGSMNAAIKKLHSTVGGRALRVTSVRLSSRSRPSRPSGSAAGGQRGSRRRTKKPEAKGARSRAGAADSAARTEEGRGADGKPSSQSALQNSHPSLSLGGEGAGAKKTKSGTAAAATKR